MNPKDWKITKKELNKFLLVFSLVYFIFILTTSALLAEFGSRYGFDRVSVLFLLEISVSFAFLVFFKRCERSKENYYHIMAMMTLFASFLFLMLLVTFK
ncbi:MAG: hypothetical protein HZB67_01415 [Candidatus Aenigmarchaeota archaeon]|nr:hypothetical protein [Candidatus Aenigmarchaeota archaeon]